MIDDIIVIDNAISSNYQEAIFNRVLDDRNFPWYYIPNITKRSQGEDVKQQDSFGFAHSFLDRNGGHSILNDFLLPLAYEACDKISYTPNGFYYGRIFMTVAMENSPKHNMYHVDMVDPHLVCLYYVNDSTGPTVITDSTVHNISQNDINNKKDVNIIRTIEPKKGRAVLFDGKYYHASSNPDEGRRCIINFNIA
jgi:hypothetical protein